ncbi:MAG: hypothetical protein M3Q23_10500 [Actinomycetota bacterium]|nr:hypothetical protein [Actinomycetota bacterium]
MGGVWDRVAVAAAVTLLLGASACRAGPSGPPPVSPPTVPPPVQTLRFTGGEATVRVSGAVTASFVAPLAPSSLYPSPPAELVLSWGTGGSADGLDFQGPPVTGAAPTSDQEILVLTVAAGGEVVEASSLDGECTVTLASVAPGDVRGSFTCRNLPAGVGGTSRIDATGTFTATGCAPELACHSVRGSE